MSDDLYQHCSVCRGTGELAPDTRMCLDPPSARRNLIRLENGNFRCLSCNGERFVATGVTAGQLELLVKRSVRLREEVRALKAQLRAKG